MKSNAATFGAMELSELAKEVEEIARKGQLDITGEKLVLIKMAFEQAAKALKELQNG